MGNKCRDHRWSRPAGRRAALCIVCGVAYEPRSFPYTLIIRQGPNRPPLRLYVSGPVRVGQPIRWPDGQVDYVAKV